MRKDLRKLIIFLALLLFIIPVDAAISQEGDYNRYPPETGRPNIRQRSYSYEGSDTLFMEMTIGEFLMEMDDFSILAGAVKAAGLEGALSERGPFTIFAPRDMAFRRLLPEAADYLLTCSAGKLETFLKNHLVAGEIQMADLVAGEHLTSITGKRLPIGRRWFNPVVGDAMISGNAVVLKNGLLYALDRVVPDEKIMEIELAYRETLRDRPLDDRPLVPGRQGIPGQGGMYYPGTEEMNVMDVLSQRGELSIFFGAIKASGLDYEISQTDSITVFAPVNSAFAELPPEQAEFLMTCDKGELIRILRAHLLEGSHNEVALREKASVTNLNGDTMKLEQDWFSTSIGGASIRSYEIVTANGVIHMVDKVILPGK